MSVTVMAWVWRHGPQDATERLVLLAIADHANDDGEAYPSMAGIAAKSCLTDRGARGVVRRLEAAGWITTKVGGGRGGKSVYRVLMVENPERGSAFAQPENPEPETRNDKPGMTNPECGSEFTGGNPERDCTKPGTLVPPNHQGTINKKEEGEDARDARPEPARVVALPAPPPDDAYRLYDAVLRAVGHDPAKALPTYWMPPAAVIEVTRWRGLGLTDQDIIETAKGSRRGKHRDPPNGPRALQRLMDATAKAKAAPPLSPPDPDTQEADHGPQSIPARRAAGTAAVVALTQGLRDGSIKFDTSDRDPFRQRP